MRRRLEANAALRSIVRPGHGRGLRDVPARAGRGLRHFDTDARRTGPLRPHAPEEGSNDDWTHPQDPDAKITRMKDGRTRLAHKAEHAVDLETGAVVGVTVQDTDAGDTKTMVETLITAAEQVEAVLPAGTGLTEVVGDTGYHSNETLVALAELGIRSYVSEPDRGRRRWRGKPAARAAVCANRWRIRRVRGRRLLRQRGERLQRPHAHLYETGRLRRVHLRRHSNVLKCLLVHVCGSNLGLLMRELTGVGTPRSLQGRARALLDALIRVLSRRWRLVALSGADRPFDPRDSSWIAPPRSNINSFCSRYKVAVLPQPARPTAQTPELAPPVYVGPNQVDHSLAERHRIQWSRSRHLRLLRLPRGSGVHEIGSTSPRLAEDRIGSAPAPHSCREGATSRCFRPSLSTRIPMFSDVAMSMACARTTLADFDCDCPLTPLSQLVLSPKTLLEVSERSAMPINDEPISIRRWLAFSGRGTRAGATP